MGELGADVWVLDKFKNGFYVDAGCADAEEYSNTLLLEKNGWNGICIDAFPRNFHSRKCIVEQACLGSENNQTVEFLLSKHQQNLSGVLSGLTDHYKDMIVQTGHEILQLKTVTLENILEKHNAPKFIEYLNLDIEGNEYEVLKIFPFEKYTFGCISVEHNFQEPKRTLIRKLLESKGYSFEKEVKWDDWFVFNPPDFIFEKCISEDQCHAIDKHANWSNVKRVLEVGFGAGHSARYFLSRGPDVYVTSLELNQRDYTLREKKLIDEKFPGRHEMVWGDSKTTLPKLSGHKFDLIFIDGSHDLSACRLDIMNCMRLVNPQTLVIVPDVSYEHEWTVKYTLGITRAWQQFVEISVIEELAREQNICVGRYLVNLNPVEHKQLSSAFRNAELGISKITDEIIQLPGFSGVKTRHFYNNLLSRPDARYLEVGTWKGSTACSAMYKNKADMILIDNWVDSWLFDPWTKSGGNARKECIENIEKFKGENSVSIIESDAWKVDVSKIPKRNIYVYDGDHTEESHYKALIHFYDCLDDAFIFIVDDWNWDYVRKGTHDAIRDLRLKVLEEVEVRLTQDGTPTIDRQGWWNGFYACVLVKTRTESLSCKF